MFSLKSPKSPATFHSPSQRYAAAGSRGQGMTEFVFILVGVSMACILVCTTFGWKVHDNFEIADTELGDVNPAGL